MPLEATSIKKKIYSVDVFLTFDGQGDIELSASAKINPYLLDFFKEEDRTVATALKTKVMPVIGKAISTAHSTIPLKKGKK